MRRANTRTALNDLRVALREKSGEVSSELEWAVVGV